MLQPSYEYPHACVWLNRCCWRRRSARLPTFRQMIFLSECQPLAESTLFVPAELNSLKTQGDHLYNLVQARLRIPGRLPRRCIDVDRLLTPLQWLFSLRIIQFSANLSRCSCSVFYQRYQIKEIGYYWLIAELYEKENFVWLC